MNPVSRRIYVRLPTFCVFGYLTNTTALKMYSRHDRFPRISSLGAPFSLGNCVEQQVLGKNLSGLIISGIAEVAIMPGIWYHSQGEVKYARCHAHNYSYA